MSNTTYVIKDSLEAKRLENLIRQKIDDLDLAENLIIAIGGDGTMLEAVRRYMDADAIFIGVAAGSLGLLQTINESNLDLLVDALKSGNYEILQAPLMAAYHCHPSSQNAKDDEVGSLIGYAFNDISIERQESRAAKFKLKIDDSSGDFIGDGVIFSTPIGSTAYSLAAGGPIIDSRLQEIFVITPNNPHLSSLHSSLQRPHVLSRQRRVRVELTKADRHRPLQIAIDGEVAARDIITPVNISISDKKVRILQLDSQGISKQIEEKRLGRV